MINKANMRAWVAALRSGQYEQGQSALTPVLLDGRETYCCLGVACAISGVAEKKRDTFADGRGDIVRWGGENEVLPRSVMNWLGVGTSDPWVSATDRASDANDERLWPFAEIADALEKYYALKSTT